LRDLADRKEKAWVLFETEKVRERKQKKREGKLKLRGAGKGKKDFFLRGEPKGERRSGGRRKTEKEEGSVEKIAPSRREMVS